MTHGEGIAFTINGRTFDPQRTDAIVKLGSIEEWEIIDGGGMMMAFDHPFHIHTNAFQVVARMATAYPSRLGKTLSMYQWTAACWCGCDFRISLAGPSTIAISLATKILVRWP
jgi:FtsP/CotA-like multicopper oxidase with cupredoxin domain